MTEATTNQAVEAPPAAPTALVGFDPATTLALVLTYPDGAMPVTMAGTRKGRLTWFAARPSTGSFCRGPT